MFTAPTPTRRQFILGDVLSSTPRMIAAVTLRADDPGYLSSRRSVMLWMRLGNATTTAFPMISTNPEANIQQPTDVLGSATAPGWVNLPDTLPGQPIWLPFDAGRVFVHAGTAGLVVEIEESAATVRDAYPVDTANGTRGFTVGGVQRNGMQSCYATGNRTRFQIGFTVPALGAGVTTCSVHGNQGPIHRPGVLVVGFADPATNFAGLLCAPLRAAPDVTLPVHTNTNGHLTPTLLTFPNVSAPVTFFTQWAIVDPGRPANEVPVTLSDGLRWDITPPTPPIERYKVASGVVTETGIPVMQFN